jgi:hypothetical protein
VRRTVAVTRTALTLAAGALQRNGAYVPSHPGNGLLRGYGLSTCIEGRESLVGLADAYNPMIEDQ